MTLVHDTAGGLVPAQLPPLTLPAVTPVLDRYALTARAVTWHSPRPLSSAALVRLADGDDVLVKRHPLAARRAAHLGEEHRFGAHLRAHGLPVPAVLATPGGDTAVEHDGGAWEVCAVGDGEDAYRDTPSWHPPRTAAHAVALGAVLARVAAAGASHQAPPRAAPLLTGGWQVVGGDDLADRLDRFLAPRPAAAAALDRHGGRGALLAALAPLHDALLPHLPALPPGWTHGDGHPSNLLWRGDAVTAVLDLGLADRATPLLDLAVAVERCAVGWLDAAPVARAGVAEALLRGWHDVRPLTAAEAAALPALLAVCHVDFALTELGHYDQVVHAPADAAAARAYLLDRLAWWRSPGGAAVLDLVGALARSLGA